MRLYVANLTQQNWTFTYRTPSNANARAVPIQMGAQAEIGGDITQAEADLIIEQNRKYGLVSCEEMGKRGEPAPCLIYSLNKQVPLSKIYEGLKAYRDSLDEAGREVRQKAAIGMSKILSDAVAPVQELESSIIEDTKKPPLGEKHIEETVAVVADEKAPPSSRRRRKE
ncbi:MAG: hypothetical protein N2444_00230 [Methylocystis sp.]|nr:hypothetical protein [Methylocystis sp.]